MTFSNYGGKASRCNAQAQNLNDTSSPPQPQSWVGKDIQPECAQSSDLQRSGTRAVQQVWFQGRSVRLLPISGFTDRGYWIGTAVVMHRVGKDKLVFLIISM